MRRYRYVGEIKNRCGAVAVDADATRASGERHDLDDEQPSVLDVLPAAVRAQLMNTVPDPRFEDQFLVQDRHKGRPYKHRAGVIRASPRQIIAVLATRQIEQRRSGSVREAERQLASAPWDLRALTARFGREEVVTLEVVDDEVALDGGGAIALPPSSSDAGRSG
ncbi:hypothetical protein [Jiangella alba]|uniref:Uncharacterized protein n=1 Tax=Jiangella alba TaxID=561176 RepID=A0A1H5PMI3_9ACTN|nr:hypothetical protein [Jiangella alba]SEF14909.1 hypothetical protein SAMN04488561_4778 [Jiangella alba]